MTVSPYENDRVVNEYLLFHYGAAGEILPFPFGPRDALDFAVRCVTECAHPDTLPANPRALDLGCAVGRSSFELSRHCDDVVGIDYSHRFIEAAKTLQRDREIVCERIDEGELTTRLKFPLPAGVRPECVSFRHGDAENLPEGLGEFDLVLMANLIDRLKYPRRCLDRLPGLVRPGGRLVITSPYTWLTEFTAKENWLGGRYVGDRAVSTNAALKDHLKSGFDFHDRRDLPFLIREHSRKYQWSVAEATVWIRRST